MAIKFEKKFKIEDVFNINTDYHLWMLSVGAARQDLYFVNEKLIDIIYGDKKERYFYYAKMSIAHVNEAVALLKNAFDVQPNIGTKFRQINGVANAYEELLELTEGNDKDSFYKKVLSGARNNIFHYNKGTWNDKAKEYDFDKTRRVLNSMYKENFITGYKIGESKVENDFYFAEEVQLNWLSELGKEYKLDEKQLLLRISHITAKVMQILSMILDDFLINKADRNVGFQIKYRR
jgi:hypothetical protein